MIDLTTLPERTRPRPKPVGYRVTGRDANGFAFARKGAETKVLLDGQMMKWATSEWVSQDFIDRCAALRNQENKAPRGDSTGCWQKVAEIPFSMLLDKLPPDAWDDSKAAAKILNDPDFRAFRTDGNHRRL